MTGNKTVNAEVAKTFDNALEHYWKGEGRLFALQNIITTVHLCFALESKQKGLAY